MYLMSASWKLTEEDTDIQEGDPVSIRASRNPNSLVLSAVLEEGNRLLSLLPPHSPPHKFLSINFEFSANTHIPGSVYGIYTSPLNTAITACLSQNISIILAADADSNGITLEHLDEYSVRFIRGRPDKYNNYSYVMCPPRKAVLDEVRDDIFQCAPLTTDEIAARRKVFSRFWTESELPTLRFRSLPARTSLEVAASTGDISLFDQVCRAEPEDSWWRLNPTPSQLPNYLTHSALCTSSPVHEAIVYGRTEMLIHLLNIGYSPNILPLAAPTCCFPPLMTAIAFCKPPNLEAYDILIQHPSVDLAIRTPVFSLHVLHIAIAHLDISLLQHITENPATPISAAGKTALGHTLLHIASLPLNDSHINLFSKKIFSSVHDVRTLDTKQWIPINLCRRNPANRGILVSYADDLPIPRPSRPEDEADQIKQERMVLWLLENGMQDIGAQDTYGNTPLHYLVSAMQIDDELVAKLRAWEGGDAIWRGSKNELGFTPEELWEDGRIADRSVKWKDFWMK